MMGYLPFPTQMWYPQYDPVRQDPDMAVLAAQTTSEGYNPNSLIGYNNFRYDQFGAEQAIPPAPLTHVRCFPAWMKKFARFLILCGHKDIIPDETGVAVRKPTDYEADWIEGFFTRSVPNNLYPAWFQQGIDRSIPILRMIMTAFDSENEEEQDIDLFEGLYRYSYNGEIDPRVYVAEVEETILKFENSGQNIIESLKCKLVTRGLKGDYAQMHKDLRAGKIEESMHQILFEIRHVYASQERSKRNIGEDYTPRSIKCSICQKTDHVAKYCDKKLIDKKVVDKVEVKRKKKNKKSTSKDTQTKKTWKRKTSITEEPLR